MIDGRYHLFVSSDRSPALKASTLLALAEEINYLYSRGRKAHVVDTLRKRAIPLAEAFAICVSAGCISARPV
jgi:hypothetical protein